VEYDDEPVEVVEKVEKREKLKPKTKNQAKFIDVVNNNVLTLCSSVAGVGKSHISLGIACEQLLAGKISKIIISRPVVQCGPGVGFLSGSLTEKLAPFMKNVLAICEIFLGPSLLKKHIDSQVIEIEAIETMRGNTYDNCFMILDEFQNCTYEQLMMYATRIGEECTCVISGDLEQIDNFRGPYSSGAQRFYDEQKRSEGRNEGIGFAYFTEDDIVRSKIVKTVLTNARIARSIRNNEDRG
jgi:phosphate starvation-inducible PhoH-like protein